MPMISNEHFFTQVQTDVSQQLTALDRLAAKHQRATLLQLICLIVLLITAVLSNITRMLTASNQTSETLKQIAASPLDLILIGVMVVAFTVSWVWWAKDMKYQNLQQEFTSLYQEHTELIKTSAPLTEISAHFRHQMRLATHFNNLSNVIALAVIAGFVLYQLHH
ncbi:hypothetical protein [Secundilactobacillus odoratitofui]|nr:hypothetical protein [Secundilactobacillus odoratitofui]